MLWLLLVARTPLAQQKLGLGLDAARRGDGAEALAHLREASSLAPTWSLPHIKLGNVCAHLTKDDAEAEAAYARAAELSAAEEGSADEHDAHFFFGSMLSRQDHHQEAAQAFERAVSANAASEAAQDGLRNATRAAGAEPHEAEAAVQLAVRASAVRAAPESADLRLAFGHSLERAGRSAEAEVQFEAAVRAAPRRAEPHARLAQSLASGGRLKQAIAALGEAHRLDPSNGAIAFNLAHACSQHGDGAAALKHYAAAAAAQPGSQLGAKALFAAGTVLRGQGRIDEAAASYAAAIAAAPSEAASTVARAQYNLGNLRREQGRSEEAVACFSRAIAADPTLADAYAGLRRETNVPHRTTCTAEQPLTRRAKPALPAPVYAELRSAVLAHPWVGRANTLSSSFQGTRGFVIRFTRDGHPRLRAHPQLSCLLPFVELATLRDANCFVMSDDSRTHQLDHLLGPHRSAFLRFPSHRAFSLHFRCAGGPSRPSDRGDWAHRCNRAGGRAAPGHDRRPAHRGGHVRRAPGRRSLPAGARGLGRRAAVRVGAGGCGGAARAHMGAAAR